MAKLNLDFVLIDESVVLNDFRALTSGAQLDNFVKNPVMLFMHNRPIKYEGIETAEPLLTIGKWYDIRVADGKLLAKPDFDDNDDFAQKIQKKVEAGYYNAASIWIEPIAVSDDPTLKLAGQAGPTITSWGLFEASIVDIPNCRNALAIRDAAGELMQLAADTHRQDAIDYLKTFLPKKTKMETKLFAVKLGLKEDADDNAINAQVDALLSLRENGKKITAENAELKTRLAAMEKAAQDEKINQLVGTAVKEKKILQGDVEKYTKLAVADYDTTKALLDGMTPAQSVKEQFEKHAQPNGSDAEFAKQSWDEIDRANKLGVLWDKNPELYKVKFEEKFGHAPKEK